MYCVTEGDGILAGHYHKLQSFPQSWAVPPKQVNFHGVSVSVPNSAACILADTRCVWSAVSLQVEMLGALFTKNK